MLTKLNHDQQSSLAKQIENHLAWPPLPPEQSETFLILALCGEVGELANMAKKNWRGDVGSEERRQEMIKELADIGNYTFMLAERFGVDLLEAMTRKFAEVEQRPAWKARGQS